MKLKLTIDGKVYEVDVEVYEPEPSFGPHLPVSGGARPPATTPTAPRPATAGAPVADEAKVCRSPFAGTVTKIAAQVGQEIQVDDVLMVLEAMKMETVITAPIAGKVARVNAHVGDAVQQGQILVEVA